MKPELKYILKEMCKRVGANYDSIDFKEDGWFRKYSWSEEEQNDFAAWLSKELYNKPKLLKAVGYFPHKTRRNCARIADSFVSNYGWNFKKN